MSIAQRDLDRNLAVDIAGVRIETIAPLAAALEEGADGVHDPLFVLDLRECGVPPCLHVPVRLGASQPGQRRMPARAKNIQIDVRRAGQLEKAIELLTGTHPMARKRTALQVLHKLGDRLPDRRMAVRAGPVDLYAGMAGQRMHTIDVQLGDRHRQRGVMLGIGLVGVDMGVAQQLARRVQPALAHGEVQRGIAVAVRPVHLRARMLDQCARDISMAIAGCDMKRRLPVLVDPVRVDLRMLEQRPDHGGTPRFDGALERRFPALVDLVDEDGGLRPRQYQADDLQVSALGGRCQQRGPVRVDGHHQVRMALQQTRQRFRLAGFGHGEGLSQRGLFRIGFEQRVEAFGQAGQWTARPARRIAGCRRSAGRTLRLG